MNNNTSNTPNKKNKGFLGVSFIQCGVYGRLYKNKEGNAYRGNCPKCGKSLIVGIASNGTDRRFFQANCS